MLTQCCPQHIVWVFKSSQQLVFLNKTLNGIAIITASGLTIKHISYLKTQFITSIMPRQTETLVNDTPNPTSAWKDTPPHLDAYVWTMTSALEWSWQSKWILVDTAKISPGQTGFRRKKESISMTTGTSISEALSPFPLPPNFPSIHTPPPLYSCEWLYFLLNKAMTDVVESHTIWPLSKRHHSQLLAIWHRSRPSYRSTVKKQVQ